MLARFTVIMALCTVLLGCQVEDREVADRAVSQVPDMSTQPRRSFDSHYMGVGKQIAVVLSAQDTEATAQLEQSWVMRIVDQHGVPISSADIEIMIAAPVSQPPHLRAVSNEQYEGDGFYTIGHLPFTDPGQWHLDVRVVWHTIDHYKQEDHATITVEVLPPL